MPYALIVIGLVMLVSGVRNTQADLFRLVKADFTGQGNFVYWFVAIMIIGAVGYVEKLKPVANGFLALVVVVLFIGAGKRGFFEQFNRQIESSASPSYTPTNFSTASFGGTFGTPPFSPVATPNVSDLSLPGFMLNF